MNTPHLFIALLCCLALRTLAESEFVCRDGWCEETSAMPLVSNFHHLLKMNKIGIEKLNSWTASKVYTLSFIGPGRKGKSTLATRFIPCDSRFPGGFQVGSTMEPVTEGIDMWGQEIPFKDGNLLLLDTEGTDNPFGNLQHQRRLSVLVSLLSSLVIYNVMDTLTTHDIDKLAELIDFRHMIKYESESDSWPALIILIQNSRLQFSLKGKSLTNDQYLEYLLENKGDEHDRSRNLIKSFFSFRTLNVLPPPSPQDLDQVRCPLNTDTPYYKAFLDFKKSVENIITPKAFGERVASPKDIARILPEFVEGANADEIDLPTIQSRINEKRLQTIINTISLDLPFPSPPTECDPQYKDKVQAVMTAREKSFVKQLESQRITGTKSIKSDEVLQLRKFYGGMITNHSKAEVEHLVFGVDRLCVVKHRKNLEQSLSNHPLLSPNFLPKDKLVIRNNLKDLSERAVAEFESKLEGISLPTEELDLHRALLSTYVQQLYARIVKGLRDHIEALAFRHEDLCPLTVYKSRIMSERQEILESFLAEISPILPRSETDHQKQLLGASLEILERQRTEDQRELCRPNLKALLYMRGPKIICQVYYFDDVLNKMSELSKQDWIRFEEQKDSPKLREQTRQVARGTNLAGLDKWIKDRDYLKEALQKDCEALDSY